MLAVTNWRQCELQTFERLMNIYLTDQTSKLHRHLDKLLRLSVMTYDKEKLLEKITTADINTTRSFADLDLEFLLDYKIFPSKILTYLTQWNFEKRKIKVGDTIVQQVYLPPLGQVSQKIIFGVRINEVISEPTRKGFSYETLAGHVEKGVSTFTVEQTADKKIIFKIQTFSKPGNILTQFLGPIFSVPYQTYCTRQAINNVKRQLETK